MALSRQLRDAVRGSYLQPNDVGDDSHIYLDINVRGSELGNTTDYGRQAVYSATKTQPLIANPEKYHLSVDRFSISGRYLPIYIFDPVAPPAVWLEYDGFSVKTDFVFVFRATNPPNPAVVPFNQYYYVYDIEHFCTMMNTAFATAFTALGALVALPVGSVAPFIVWNESQQLASLYAQDAHYDIADPTPIKIFWNTTVNETIMFMPFIYDSSDKWQVRMTYYYNNRETRSAPASPTGDFLFCKQQAVGAKGFNCIRSIIFTSTSIPVASTYTNVNTQSANGNLKTNDDTNSMAILIDYKIDPTFPMSQRTDLLYVAGDNTRKLDLIGNTPLRNININVYWVDTHGNIYPLVVGRNEELNVKLLFTKKTQDF
jgi:hypothetical protein